MFVVSWRASSRASFAPTGTTQSCRSKACPRWPLRGIAPGLEEAQRIDVVAHQQVFGLLIVVEHHFVGFTADAGLFVTTERGMRRVQVIAVGPHATGLDRPPHAVGTVDVAGPETSAQAKLAVVGNR